MSSSVLPGATASLPQIISSLARCASARVTALA
jgi:hypothetical protein